MRQSGILLHITSLPGPEGIGTLGKSAYAFADFLKSSGMSVWQVLPISPTGYGESPYQSFSTYAGSPLMIDLETLADEGLISKQAPVKPADRVDYPLVMAFKEVMLREAFSRADGHMLKEAAEFAAGQAHWLSDYSLFMALKAHFGGGPWMDWPDEGIRRRNPDAMEKYSKLLWDDIRYHSFVQYLFFKQWRALKTYANRLGIRVFGDMPIYVAMDSSDCWSSPDVFQLDSDLKPTAVAGVPPDYFSRDGQLWGNPLYDWKAMKRTGYAWWINRLRAMGDYYDLIRVDHFIGFANYYAVPYGASTARNGCWRRGPGRHFFSRVKKELPQLNIIAEDLGAVNHKVKLLLDYCGYPGMKVLSFGFSGGDDNTHRLHRVKRHCVAYTGTHDNDTLLGWWSKAGQEEKENAARLLHMKEGSDITDAMMQALFGSPAKLVILPMQDILRLDGSARMNLPGTLGGNWAWRMRPDAVNPGLSAGLRALNMTYERENKA